MEREKLTINKIRAFYFMSGLLKLQQEDPRCSVCKSRKEVAEEIMERFNEFKAGVNLDPIPEIFKKKFQDVEDILSKIKLPEKPIPQRKEGNCHFPDKECLVKECFEVFEDLVEEDED
ncbi:hypothetical protein THC_0745 [Caldimicrobium thiodismutans]|jgi:hypothetical protein|uniref:Uncharacterized protein n=1 Tax=Caldimicrobium thiodismutans TaxID=1653476 RepID=A0A0U5B4Z6_9BACT|nr:hypothetical protein [Caldimicrobium thiodismutans]BAU23136.1 hypothetical protein THC_0745 [Caldimicrobium thiodismutans]